MSEKMSVFMFVIKETLLVQGGVDTFGHCVVSTSSQTDTRG